MEKGLICVEYNAYCMNHNTDCGIISFNRQLENYEFVYFKIKTNSFIYWMVSKSFPYSLKKSKDFISKDIFYQIKIVQ